MNNNLIMEETKIESDIKKHYYEVVYNYSKFLVINDELNKLASDKNPNNCQKNITIYNFLSRTYIEGVRYKLLIHLREFINILKKDKFRCIYRDLFLKMFLDCLDSKEYPNIDELIKNKLNPLYSSISEVIHAYASTFTIYGENNKKIINSPNWELGKEVIHICEILKNHNVTNDNVIHFVKTRKNIEGKLYLQFASQVEFLLDCIEDFINMIKNNKL